MPDGYINSFFRKSFLITHIYLKEYTTWGYNLVQIYIV